MSARRGQVALYLVLVLVAITILVLMNANVFLAVRAKNHAMAAGDAAVLRAAAVQGELLNEIGRLNVARLQAALDNRPPDYDYEGNRDCDDEIRIKCFLGPLRALREAQNAARAAVAGLDSGGLEQFETTSMAEVLRQHVFDIRNIFEQNPMLYPEPWEGAWETYAQELELALSDGMVSGPDNCEFADAYEEFPLLSQQFYRAIEGRQWCWFFFNGEWVLNCDSHNMPAPTRPEYHSRDNSEIYSLHLSIRSLPEHLDEEWKAIIMRLTDCSRADIENSWVLTNGTHKFAFYDRRWNEWSSYNLDGRGTGFTPAAFPIRGPVKAQYDVYGCTAVGRVIRTVPDCLEESESAGSYVWLAAAKPLGTEINLEGDEDKVTCLKRLVTPAFTDVRLVPVDAAGGLNGSTADAQWMEHVRDHILPYLESGPGGLSNCPYCRLLKEWEPDGFRKAGLLWLQNNSDKCRWPTQSGDYYGGTVHGS